MNAASGSAARSLATSSELASMATASWPSRCSASRTCAPERSETPCSSERPPLSTATFFVSANFLDPPWLARAITTRSSLLGPPRCRVGGVRFIALVELEHVREAHAARGASCARVAHGGRVHVRRRRCGRRARQRPEHSDLLAQDLADAPDSLANVLVGHACEVQPHRGAATPVHVRRTAGHERDALALQRSR